MKYEYKTKGQLIWIGAAFVIVALAVGGYFWFSLEQPRKYTRAVEKLTLAAYKGDTGALVYIAQEQGYFTENGLDVTIKDYEAGKLAADALLANEADISTSADFVLVSNSFEHDNLRVLGTVALADINELVARRDRGIATPGDLKGKKIGVTRKSIGEFFLGTFLIFEGLSLADVEVVDLKPSEIVEAISAGEIDAALTWEPNIFKIKSLLGANVISWPGQSGQDFFFILLSKEEWLKEHPSAVERFLRALVQAEEFVKKNNEKAKHFVAERFDYESKYVESIWSKHRFLVVLPQALLLAMEDQARWKIKNKLTDATEVPNYLDFIYLDGMKEVKPEAITIMH
ncbi:NrtA/SsuA/CpmA family ABC transporter substrate-binding protein [bacterium]|nr:NrtA/SsuA/CpmA family ABC transporter substrate-binding protein [bacterium]